MDQRRVVHNVLYLREYHAFQRKQTVTKQAVKARETRKTYKLKIRLLYDQSFEHSNV